LTARIRLPIDDGLVIAGGDLHAWPGAEYPGFDWMLDFVRRLKPSAIILNGDIIDGARISRHARIGWEAKPMVHEELEEAKGLLADLQGAARKRTPLFWCLGNHDARFETTIANALPAYERVPGLHLKDHFPAWQPCWSVQIGEADGLLLKHRYRGGVHAAYNNVRLAGCSIATGHTHQLGVTAVTDYGGTRYGIELGMLADPQGPAFQDWLEDSPRNWRMGFGVFTFKNGRLLHPELVYVRADGVAEFRGEEL
jgi:hypothetical protein